MIQYTDRRQFAATDFREYNSTPGYSHSFLKYETAGAHTYTEPTDKMKLGILVDGLITEPDRVKINDSNKHLFGHAQKIATCIQDKFGFMIPSLKAQENFTATATITELGFSMPVKGRTDWRLPGHAVLDLKITAAKNEEEMRKLIVYMGYENAMWNYAKMAGVSKGYIIPYSTKINKCLSPIAMDLSGDHNEFWYEKILKFGTVQN